MPSFPQGIPNPWETYYREYARQRDLSRFSTPYHSGEAYSSSPTPESTPNAGLTTSENNTVQPEISSPQTREPNEVSLETLGSIHPDESIQTEMEVTHFPMTPRARWYILDDLSPTGQVPGGPYTVVPTGLMKSKDKPQKGLMSSYSQGGIPPKSTFASFSKKHTNTG